MIFQDFRFFDENSDSFESEILINTHCDEIVFSVVPVDDAEIDITMEGAVKKDSNDYEEIAILNTKDFDMNTHVTSGGNYICPVVGLSKIKCVNNGDAGSVKVYGKLVI